MELSEMATEIVKIIFTEKDKKILILTSSYLERKKTLDYLVTEIEHPTFKFDCVNHNQTRLRYEQRNHDIYIESTDNLERIRTMSYDHVFLDWKVEELMAKYNRIKSIITNR